MPYRRGYVPPFPDFSKTGMSYSEEEQQECCDEPVVFLIIDPAAIKSEDVFQRLPGKSWWLSG